MAMSDIVLAQILFAETADMTVDPADPTGLQMLRATLARLIYLTGDGQGFAAPRDPTSVDYGSPSRLEAWQNSLAAARHLVSQPPSANSVQEVVVLNDVDPTTVRGMVDAYSWLAGAKAAASGSVLDRNLPVTAWLIAVGSGVAPGRYPRPPSRPIATAGRAAPPAIGTAIVCVIAALVLLSISGWQAYRASRDGARWIAALSGPAAGQPAAFDTALTNARKAVDNPDKAASDKEPEVPAKTSDAVSALEKLKPDLVSLALDAGKKAAAANDEPDDAQLARNASKARNDFYAALREVAPLANKVTQRPKNDEVPRSEILKAAMVPDIRTAGAIALAAVLMLLIGTGIGLRRNPVGALIDDRGRLSLSRLQLAGWTIIILGGYWTLSFWNIGVGATGAIRLPAMEPDLWMLLGVVTVSPLASALVLSGRRNAPETEATARAAGATTPPAVPAAAVDHDGPIDVRKEPGQWSILDLFTGEEVANRGSVDLTRIQNFIFTLVSLFAYAALLFDLFTSLLPGVSVDAPRIGASVVGLLAISHGAYLAAKAIPK